MNDIDNDCSSLPTSYPKEAKGLHDFDYDQHSHDNRKANLIEINSDNDNLNVSQKQPSPQIDSLETTTPTSSCPQPEPLPTKYNFFVNSGLSKLFGKSKAQTTEPVNNRRGIRSQAKNDDFQSRVKAFDDL